MSETERAIKGPDVPGGDVPGRVTSESGAGSVPPDTYLGPVGVVARHARAVDTSEAIAMVQRALADQDSSAALFAGDGYVLTDYDPRSTEPFTCHDGVVVEDITDDELARYWAGSLKRLPLVADQLDHAVTAMLLDPTVDVGVGHLMEALDRIVDTIGTLKVVGDEVDRRGHITTERE